MSDRLVIGTYRAGVFEGRFCSTSLFGNMPFAVVDEFASAAEAIAYLFAPPHDAWSYDIYQKWVPGHVRFERNPAGRVGLWTMEDTIAAWYLDGYMVIDPVRNTVTSYWLNDGVATVGREETWE